MKRMSDSEWQGRREKGLCFRYDEKYTLGHQFKNRELRVLLVQEDEAAADSLPWAMEDPVELSLNSIVGLTTPGTMKL